MANVGWVFAIDVLRDRIDKNQFKDYERGIRNLRGAWGTFKWSMIEDNVIVFSK